MKKNPSSLWFQPLTIDDLNHRGKDTMAEHLDIRFIDVGADYLVATMPVDHRTKQPRGLLHGGASVALAETIGSMAGNFCVDPSKFYCVGLEINANHVRAMTEGFVSGKATPLHLGRKTQVWEIKITNADHKLVCISRLTMAVMEHS
ncbi:MAG: hotdog fold thioesterase [Deltaproteobacteria bacterium]|nr:hotdog fold thioesterase [Deltaproteobacteria bacterium]